MGAHRTETTKMMRVVLRSVRNRLIAVSCRPNPFAAVSLAYPNTVFGYSLFAFIPVSAIMAALSALIPI